MSNIPSTKIDSALFLVDRAGSKRTASLVKNGLTPNLDKQAVLLCLLGHKSVQWRKQYKELRSNIVQHLRYLGPHLSENNNSVEIELRIVAATHAFFCFAKCFRSSAPLLTKTMIFNAAVVSLLISGLVASFLSAHEESKLDKIVVNHLRQILCGAATDKT